MGGDAEGEGRVTPQRIEELRCELLAANGDNIVDEESNALCELALDGLRFRKWIELASTRPGLVASTLAPCTIPKDYRRAIDKLIVEDLRSKGGR